MKLHVFLLITHSFELGNILCYPSPKEGSTKVYKDAKVIQMSWKDSIKQWVSFQMRNTLKKGFLEVQSSIRLLCKNIWMICFCRNSPLTFSSKHIKGLCGSLKVMDIMNINYPEWQLNITNTSYLEWELKVPDNMCTNITIVDLPTSDQFLHETFTFAITTTKFGNISFIFFFTWFDG